MKFLRAGIYITGLLVFFPEHVLPQQPRDVIRLDIHSDREGISIAGIAFSRDGRTFALAETPHALIRRPDGRVFRGRDGVGVITLRRASDGRVLSTLRGHQAPITAMAMSPDGSTLASASRDKSIRLWNVRDGKPMALFKSEARVPTLAWSPDGKFIAAGTGHGAVELWRLRDGRRVYSVKGHSYNIRRIIWQPRGGTFAAMVPAANTIYIRRPGDGELLRTAKVAPSHEYAAAWSPDGKLMAIGTDKGLVQVLRFVDGKMLWTFRGHRGRYSKRVRNVLWSNDGKIIASGGVDGTIRLWNAEEGRNIRVIKAHDQEINHLAWGPAGKTIASAGGDRRVRVWRLRDGKPLLTIEHNPAASEIKWSPDGRFIAAGSYTGNLRLYSARDGRLLYASNGYRLAHMNAPVWLNGGETLAMTSGGDVGHVHLLNTRTMGFAHLWNSTHGDRVAWSRDGRTLATSSPARRVVKLWRANDGSLLRRLRAGRYFPERMNFSPKGERMAVSARSTVMVRRRDDKARYTLWGARRVTWLRGTRNLLAHRGNERFTLHAQSNGRLLREFKRERRAVARPDGRVFVSLRGWRYPVFILRRARDGRYLRRFRARVKYRRDIRNIVWRPDGEYLAVEAGRFIHVFRGRNGRRVRRIKAYSRGTAFNRAKPVWSPDGKLIAVAGRDHSIRLYDALKGRRVGVIKGHEKKIVGFAWHPGGKLFASASWDGSVKLWRIRDRKLLVTLSFFSDHAVLIHTPDDRFEYRKPWGRDYVGFRVGTRFAAGGELEQLRQTYYTPGLLKQVLKSLQFRSPQ